ncbi:hypothetical protein HZQ75_05875 [Elizabethkingia anophelis]|uniref:Uncharacterized protein n=2 Tax=Elizabethkingia anophelis TaxID=1117645 RepID=A0A455ZFH2_9FLAO|nr:MULTISPECIES: hypothetical protein [Elizabethkingia]ATC37787.1 hypothetical protein BAZ09_016725 [Elizabethkingia anophelis R26]ATC41467.1 hypothetical protein EAAG1_016940 [Elizabethkingia anophelis Ag1]ATC45144.1 hypothetical protein CMV41_16940 [Elizabethkingia anophelis]ATC48820.1 hypothetical protein CMV40_16940 [Elizabethkingia anophelis]ELR80772.1 hypothetical protein D505_02707 [Elizabethkingia anophelis R26]
MKKTLLYPLLWGGMSLCLFSCRTEDIAFEKNENAKLFATLTPKHKGEVINYAEGFASLMQRYDKLQKTNLVGVRNKPVIGTFANTVDTKVSVHTSNQPYIEFGVHSSTFTERNGDKWVVFPKIQDNKVVKLVIATLTQEGTYIKYETYGPPNKWFEKNVGAFQAAIDEYRRRNFALVLNASSKNISPMAGQNCVKIPNGWDCGIDGVIINGGKPSGGGSGGGGGEGPEPPEGGFCGQHEDCDTNVPGGSGEPPIDNDKDPCSRAATNNVKATNHLAAYEINATKNAMTQNITTSTNEKSFVFGPDENGYYKTSTIKEGNGGAAPMPATHTDFSVEGGAHTHTPDVYNVASSGDIYKFYYNHKENSNYNYYYTLSQGDNNYVFTIVDQAAFDNFFKNYPDTKENFDMTTQTWNETSQIGKDYRNIINSFQNSNMSDDDIMDLVMAAMIQKYNMGIALSKADSSGNFNGIYAKEIKDPNDPSKTTYTITPDCNL